VQGGGVRLNGDRVTKPARSVGIGDVLTFSLGRTVRVVRVEGIGARRGPATEAQMLYTDLSPEPASRDERPDRDERRKAIEAKRRPLE
jgi:ribosome-associated heat shock protein Hsp15